MALEVSVEVKGWIERILEKHVAHFEGIELDRILVLFDTSEPCGRWIVKSAPPNALESSLIQMLHVVEPNAKWNQVRWVITVNRLLWNIQLTDEEKERWIVHSLCMIKRDSESGEVVWSKYPPEIKDFKRILAVEGLWENA